MELSGERRPPAAAPGVLNSDKLESIITSPLSTRVLSECLSLGNVHPICAPPVLPNPTVMPRQFLTNRELAELLALEAEEKEFPAKRALGRAARLAHLWPYEAAELVRKDLPLTELAGVGPYLQKMIRGWIEDPPRTSEPPNIRKQF